MVDAKIKRLSHLYDMNPVRIELEITEICNLRCLFCYNDSERTVAPFEFVKSCIDVISSQGVLELVLTGGEPMSHPSFDEIVRYAVAKIPCVMVQTNGTFMTRVAALRLNELGVAGVNISLHGIANDNATLTGSVDAYEKAVEGIRGCLSVGLMLWVNAVLTKHNAEGLVDHLVALRLLGVRSFTFTRFTPIGSLAQKEIELPQGQLLELLCRIVEFSKSHDAEILLANAYPYCGLPSELKHLSEICTYGLAKFYIDVNGNVLYCGMSRLKLGNIFEKNFKEIKADSAIFRLNAESKLAPEKCHGCNDFCGSCRGGCRAAALAANGNISGEDPLMM